MPTHFRGRRLVALWFASLVYCVSPALAQDRPLHNVLELSYAATGFVLPDPVALGSSQYLGAGAGYRFMLKPWIGVQVQATKFPQNQSWQDAEYGFAVFLANGDLLAGHRWGKVGVFGEVGGGRFHTGVFRGITPQLVLVYASRNYPDLQTGVLAEVWLGRRWSATFEARDNLIFIGPYTGFAFTGPVHGAGGTFNAPEGRSGVAFHF